MFAPTNSENSLFMGMKSDILPLKVQSKLETDDSASSKSTASTEDKEPITDATSEPPLKSFAQTLWRTRVCKHFMKGTCRYGEKCGFAHDEDVNSKPDLVKTTLCSRFQKGSCRKGRNCNFAHGLEDLKVVILHDVPEPVKAKAEKPKKMKQSTEKSEKKQPQKPANKVVSDMEPQKIVLSNIDPMKCPLQPMKCPLPSTTPPRPISGLDFAEPRFIPRTTLPSTQLQHTVPSPLTQGTTLPSTRLQHTVPSPLTQGNLGMKSVTKTLLLETTLPLPDQSTMERHSPWAQFDGSKPKANGYPRTPPGLHLEGELQTGDIWGTYGSPSMGQSDMANNCPFADIWCESK